MFGRRKETVSSLSQRLAQAHIVVSERDVRIDDLETAYLTARAEVEDLQAENAVLRRQVEAMNRAWNDSLAVRS